MLQPIINIQSRPPFPTPTSTPTPITSTRKPTTRTIVLAVLACIVVIGSSIAGFLIVKNQQDTTLRNNNATATANTNATTVSANATSTVHAIATATAIPIATATALATSPYPAFKTLALSDSLLSSSSNWAQSAACSFTKTR